MPSVRTGTRPGFRAWAMVAGVLFSLAFVNQIGHAAPAVPATGAPAGAIAFSIPRQPLTTALIAFSKRAHKEVLYDSALARGRVSAPVEGVFLSADALNRLLAGTGLVERYADTSSFVVLPEIDGNVPGETTRPIQGSVISLDTMHVDHPKDYRLYGNLIKTELQQALQNDPRTRSSKIMAEADIWIDPAGHISQVTLTSSAGGAKQDATILSVLRTVAMSRPPPPDLPQPVSVSINIRPL